MSLIFVDILRPSTLPALLGMALIIFGLSFAALDLQRWIFLCGSTLMLFTALLERHRIFIAMQTVVIAGNLAAFLPYSAGVRTLVPLALCIPVLAVLMVMGNLANSSARVGTAALLLLSIGYAVHHPALLFIAGMPLSLYALLELRAGFRPASIWLVLNLVFASVAMTKAI